MEGIEEMDSTSGSRGLKDEGRQSGDDEAELSDFGYGSAQRTPLKMKLKRVGKREHEGVEQGLRVSHETLLVGDVATPPSRKKESPLLPPGSHPLASLAENYAPTASSSFVHPLPGRQAAQSPQSARPGASSSAMATNLRSSLRTSSGGNKQVKKLVIKSTLGMSSTLLLLSDPSGATKFRAEAHKTSTNSVCPPSWLRPLPPVLF